jgi:hypothetical protein
VTRPGVVLVLLALATASEVSAGTKNFNFRCTLNTTLRACASFRVTTNNNATGGTDVVLMVRNLQGAAPDQVGGSIITRVGLTAPVNVIGAASGLVIGTSGTVGSINQLDLAGPEAKWQIKNEGINGAVQFSASAGGVKKNGGIIGCNPAGLSPNDYFQTCAALGQTGFVTFSFHTTGNWDASQAEVGLAYQGVVGLPHAVECRTEVGPTDPSFCAQVTPEPATVALLATGLFGLGGAVIRRRKGLQIRDA